MKASEVHELGAEQLESRLGELQEELFNLRFQFATRQLTNTSRIRQVRRDIARIRTRQRVLGGASGPQLSGARR
ncbi:MAG: 50S ribosomal protein L29 [Chloroflexi bacterium]|nr:50S ribosomal protein L29 [Chloroflexota bacterium]